MYMVAVVVAVAAATQLLAPVPWTSIIYLFTVPFWPSKADVMVQL
jgi:hypothetical protein